MKLFHVLVGVLIASFPLSASAYVTLTDNSEPLRVDGTLDDNVYIAGDAVDVVSPIMGDVFFAGQKLDLQGSVLDNAFIVGLEIAVNETIGNDAFIMGGEIDVNKKVEGDLRVAGGVIFIKDAVAGELMAFGEEIYVNSGVTIGRDVLLAGKTVSLAGNVAGNVYISGENVMIDAQIQGDLALLLSRDSTPILGPNAVISGKIEYTSSVRHPELDALPNTTYIQDQDAFAMTPIAPMFMNFFIAYLIYRFFSLFIIGSALFFIFQKFFLKTGAFFIKSPWKSLLYGALFYLILPLVSVILLCTIIGIPLGLFGAMSFVFSIVFAKLIAFLGTAGLIFKQLKGEKYSVWKKLLILAGIALVFAILSGITFFITFLALGAMIGAMTRTRLTDTDA